MPIQRNLQNHEAFAEALRKNPGYIIMKLSSLMCEPCKKIQPVFDAHVASLDMEHHLVIYLDVDESREVSKLLWAKRVYKSIPSILVYNPDNLNIYPDEIVVGTNQDEINDLFRRIHSKSI